MHSKISSSLFVSSVCRYFKLKLDYWSEQTKVYSHLDDNNQTDSGTHFRGVSIHASHHIHNGLSNGYNHSKHCNTTVLVRQCTGKMERRQALPNGWPVKSWRAHSHFWAPLKSALSLGVSPTSMIFAPASSCMIRPEVTMGEIPSSIRVPGGRCSRLSVEYLEFLRKKQRNQVVTFETAAHCHLCLLGDSVPSPYWTCQGTTVTCAPKP